MPEAHTACGRTQHGRMQSNDGRQACGRIMKKVNPFMIVEIGQVPERRHDDNPPHQKLRGVAMVPIVNGYAGSIIWENGATEGVRTPRSEEHTSEIQSLMRHAYAVFCLKKKRQPYTHYTPTQN